MSELGMFKEQKENPEPGVEAATGRVAGEDAREVARILITGSLPGHLVVWILSPGRREQSGSFWLLGGAPRPVILKVLPSDQLHKHLQGTF